jgi:hypothetical protein
VQQHPVCPATASQLPGPDPAGMRQSQPAGPRLHHPHLRNASAPHKVAPVPSFHDARTRAGALALRNIHPPAREPPGRDHPARRPRPSARRARSGPQDARIRDAVALSRIGGDGRPHPRSGGRVVRGWRRCAWLTCAPADVPEPGVRLLRVRGRLRRGSSHIVTLTVLGHDAGDRLHPGEGFVLWRGHDVGSGVVTRRIFV